VAPRRAGPSRQDLGLLTAKRKCCVTALEIGIPERFSSSSCNYPKNKGFIFAGEGIEPRHADFQPLQSPDTQPTPEYEADIATNVAVDGLNEVRNYLGAIG
jgi:hypothetical protein